MKILNKLTIKHLKNNPKRTLMTIMGVVVSTAIMIGIGVLISSMIATMIADAKDANGDYHMEYQTLSQSHFDYIRQNVNVESYVYNVPVGFIPLPESENNGKLYMYLQEADDNFFKKEELISGRFPKNNTEIVVSEEFYYNDRYLTEGDILTVPVGYRHYKDETDYQLLNSSYYDGETFVEKGIQTFKVVGVMKKSYSENRSSSGYHIYTGLSIPKEGQIYRMFVNYKEPKKTYDITAEIERDLGITTNTKANTSLLYYYGATKYGNVNSTMSSMMALMLTILSIAFVIIIYNSFAISTLERKKQFAIYSSVGATKKQIQKTILFEATIIGAIGLILGLIGGILGIFILIKILNSILGGILGYQFIFQLNLYYLLIPSVFMIIVIFISAFIPSMRSSKTSALEIIRQNDEIKLKKSKIKTPKWLKKILGIEGDIAFKNMKRNKSKYRISVLALFISIVTFVSFSTYVSTIESGMETILSNDYDIQVYSSDLKLLKAMQSNPLVKESTIIYSNGIELTLQNKNIFTKSYLDKFCVGDEYENYANLMIMDNENYQKYKKVLNLSDDKIVAINQMMSINYSNNDRKTEFIEIFNKPEKLYARDFNAKNEFQLENIHYTNIYPELLGELKTASGIYFILSEDMARDLNLSKSEKNYQYLYVKAKDVKALNEEYEEMSKSKNNTYVHAPILSKESDAQAMLALKILIYGFVTLVTLVGVTSVFNTIHTSMNLRKREFAMLKSIGLTPGGLNKILLFESIVMGIKALFFGLIVSAGLIYIINQQVNNMIEFTNMIVPWTSIVISIFAVFVIILMTTYFSTRKMKQENIIETIRNENV